MYFGGGCKSELQTDMVHMYSLALGSIKMLMRNDNEKDLLRAQANDGVDASKR